MLIVGWQYVGTQAPEAPTSRGVIGFDHDVSNLEAVYNEIMMSMNRSFYEPEQQETLRRFAHTY